MMQLIDSGYKSALTFSKAHYENFPVISFLLPKDLKKHIAVIYQFARQADDIADEGNETPEERLIKLNDYEKLAKINCPFYILYVHLFNAFCTGSN